MTTFSTSNVQFSLVDSSMGGTHALQYTRRVKASNAIDLSVAADAKALRDAAGKPLDPFTTFSTVNFLGTLRLRTQQFAYVPGGAGRIFDVVQQYDTAYRWSNNKGTGTLPADQYVLPIESSFEARSREVEVWRNKSWTTQPEADLNNATDIGGSKIDNAGIPVKATVAQTFFRLSLLVDVSGSQNNQTLVSLYDGLDLIRGKWNNDTFLHWPQKRVFCESADLAHVRDEFYRATYVFIWDEWYMCDQVPQRDRDGFPTLGSGPPYRASDVRWASRTRFTTDFTTRVFGTQPSATIAEQIAKEGTTLSF